MANRENSTTGEDWRRRTLCFGLDEFHGRKITVPVQQNYWKTRSQEIASSSVNDPQNAKNPSGRRSNYPKNQQVGSAGMRIGFWTRRNFPDSQTCGERKSQEHRLNVREGCSPVRQKKRGQAAYRNQAIQEEVGKLAEAGIMKEVHYHDWLSNPVMRLVDKAFHKQISRNLEVYIDDLVIKSRTEDEIVRDIEEAFKTLREINMKLNPKKCSFGVEEGTFLGYKVKTKGLKLIAELPILAAPMKKEELIVYLAATKEMGSLDTLMEVEEELPELWILFTDGSFCKNGSKAGLILTNLEGVEFAYALRFKFDATNNEAEYEALIIGLRIAEQIGVKNLQENADSRLVANQVNGTYVAKEVDMICYLKKNPQQKLTSITSSWPFYKWGIDIAGPFPEGSGKVKILIVAIDYFTKWIEVKLIATITGNQIKKFVWDNIIYRFGLPQEIISDNRKQFRDDPFKDWCEKLCICQHFASVKHPQTNGLIERANQSLEEGIKARLDARSKNWMEELPHVL
nr:reverse transcriptase domain-containing protein [Tanacetum cinerariifolium]